MPLATASSSAVSSSRSSSPAARRTSSSSNSGPIVAASSSSSRGPRVQAGDPLADDLAHARRRRQLVQRANERDPPVGDDDRRGLDQRPPQLADEEGVALGQPANRLCELLDGGVALAAGGAGDEVGDLGAGERVEPHPHDVVGAAQVGERLRQLARRVDLRVAEGAQQQHPPAPARARQVPQQQQRAGVGPVAVLQHQQHGGCRRPAPASSGGDRGVEPVAFGVRIGDGRRRQSGHASGEVGQQPRQLAGGRAQLGAQGRRRAARAQTSRSSASANGP